MPHETTITQEMRQCIQNCLDCYKMCTEMVMHNVQKGGDHIKPLHIRVLLECADICQTSANFMLMGSEFHSRTCGVCAEVCDRCAEECEEMAGDEALKRCAEMCRRCAESCRHMAGAHV